MKKVFKVIGILGALALAGCSTVHRAEETVVETVNAVQPANKIVSGTLAQARQDPKDRLFSCYYEINGRVSKAYPKRMRTCPAVIHINTENNEITFSN